MYVQGWFQLEFKELSDLVSDKDNGVIYINVPMQATLNENRRQRKTLSLQNEFE
jgi:hypothetical protein